MADGNRSQHAQRLLDLCEYGKRRNPKTLRGELGLSESEFEVAADELVAAGLVTRDRGRLRRLQQVPAGPSQLAPAPAADPRVERLSAASLLIFHALPEDGSRISNAKIRSRGDLLSLADDAYLEAKDELLASGLVRAGAGRTGTLARVVAEDAQENEHRVVAEAEEHRVEPPQPGAVVNEDELYEPFQSWLSSTLGGFAFSAAAVTASGRGRARGGGRWSRPDVTAVTVTNFELLPGATVEVSSYEIKRSVDADRVESVYEAAAHGRWAHRASLVIEVVEGSASPTDELTGEVERFGLGLYVMKRVSDGRWDIAELREPDVREPDPQNLHDLLEYFLAVDSVRGRRSAYVRAIR